MKNERSSFPSSFSRIRMYAFYRAVLIFCAISLLTACKGPVRSHLPHGIDHDTKKLATQCDKGDRYACHNVAVSIQHHTHATAAQLAMAHEMLENACRQEVDLSCRRLAYLAEGKEHHALAGAAYLDIACDRGDTDACIERASMDIRAGKTAIGFGRLTGLCEDKRSQHACMELGRRYAEGDGTEVDLEKAKTLLHAPCALGSPVACRMRAEVQLEGISSAEAITRDIIHQFGEACLADDERACRRLAGLYHAGVGVEKDPTYAASLLRRACEVQSATEACNTMLPPPIFP